MDKEFVNRVDSGLRQALTEIALPAKAQLQLFPVANTAITELSRRFVAAHTAAAASRAHWIRRLRARQLAEVDAQDMHVEQLQRRPRRLKGGQWLVLRACYPLQKSTHLRKTQLPRVPFAVEQDVRADPGCQLLRSRFRGVPAAALAFIADLLGNGPGELYTDVHVYTLKVKKKIWFCA
jgi:hypothetical protein